MSQRTAKFVSAIFASLLAGATLVTASHGAPAEAEKCLSGPKGAPPAGSHWYYRIDRTTKRQCWYIGDAKEKSARAVPETSPPAATTVAPQTGARAKLSIANARAELPLPQTRVEPETSAVTGPPAAEPVSPPSSPRADAEDAGERTSVIASRWLEPAEMATSAPLPTSGAHSVNKPRAASNAALPDNAAALPLAAAAADASSARPSGSVQQLLIAIFGALALAGLLASAILKVGGKRRTRRRPSASDRRVNWDAARTSHPPLPDDARGTPSLRDIALLPEGRLPREPRAAEDPNERIAQMLTRLARSAAT
ncbi:hypothetical protein [Bradyrhizobium sp.]|uniref:hypothetical protein n=1 Tax=Bradyrhizobium sp. TaxID=376 RepID=UPI0025C18CC2|nr:hypothetical protein [Bradyrhizobium sp.]